MKNDYFPSLPQFFFGMAIGSILTLALAFISMKIPHSTEKPTEKTIEQEFSFSGFDFRKVQAIEGIWHGPKVGTKIDLTKLKNANGSSLSENIKNNTAMLVAINPTCYYSIATKEEMAYIKEQINKLDINYYAVDFSSPDPAVDYYKFGEILGFGTDAFQWSPQEQTVPDSLAHITIPSHILVRNDGLVIQVWNGSNRQKETRQRIARQIVSDTLVINDTLNAISQKH
jgi:hypothetical protein